MWQCSCGKGCRTALECLSNVKPKKALTLDKELESNIKSNIKSNVKSNVRQSRSESRGFDKKEYQKFYMRRKRLFKAAERLTAERLTAERIGVVTFGNCIHYPGGPKRSAQLSQAKKGI